MLDNRRSDLLADHTGLLLFDTLEGYLHPPDEVLSRRILESRVIERQAEILAAARAAGLTIFYGVGDHSPDGGDAAVNLTDTDMDLKPWGDRVPPAVPKIVRGTVAARVAAELEPRPEDVIIFKNRWNAFYQTSLELQLRCRGIDTLILAGVSTDTGVMATAFGARERDFGLVVASDACWSARGDNHPFLIERVFPKMARVRKVSELVGLMGEVAPL